MNDMVGRILQFQQIKDTDRTILGAYLRQCKARREAQNETERTTTKAEMTE